MTPQLDKTLRHGGMSRRGFLRAMGVTAAAVLVPGMGAGLLVPQLMPPELCFYLPREILLKAKLHGEIVCDLVTTYKSGRRMIKTIDMRKVGLPFPKFPPGAVKVSWSSRLIP